MKRSAAALAATVLLMNHSSMEAIAKNASICYSENPDYSCDLIEINHLFSDNADRILTQVIFWYWDVHDGKFHVLEYFVNRNNRVFIRTDGTYTVYIHKSDRLYSIDSPDFRETYTYKDPEVADRDVIPLHLRKGLINKDRRETNE